MEVNEKVNNSIEKPHVIQDGPDVMKKKKKDAR
jgi:hypothetical protein